MKESMFSSIYHQKDAEVRGILGGVQCPSPRRVEELLDHSRKARPGLRELAELLEIGRQPDAGEQFEMLRCFVMDRWRRPDRNRVRYVAPIYVSSFCIDMCGYCNFAATRKDTVRKRLNVSELREEIDAVMARGARVIELVYATDPDCTTPVLAEHVALTVDALHGVEGAGVLLCTGYLPLESYEELRRAGLGGIVQWDETLDEKAYTRWHHSSPQKKEFLLRMDNHDRAARAGLDAATGALFGLADFRYDALMQIAKGQHLEAEYGRGPFVLGTARLKPIAGRELRLATTVPDRAYETALMVYRVALPDAGRWLQTREEFGLNLRNLLDGDVFTYRCGEVQPGGYHQIDKTPALRGGQFGVNELDPEYVEREFALRKIEIDYSWMTGRTCAV